ncbi:hypothetical protein FB390_5824 [Nocardia bhagyanarayanae]|uniref:Uncharacterized protein n=1 Tax=Nocardia bhagyanarayanae TaxID=1215925 RepID=A0A543EVR1_9NOCA|nr:hypothetical protein FB390_5824 [Nocardia bhagyanarayanae]
MLAALVVPAAEELPVVAPGAEQRVVARIESMSL